METKRERMKKERQRELIDELRQKMVNGNVYYDTFCNLIKHQHYNLARDLLFLAIEHGHIDSVIKLLKDASNYDDLLMAEFLLNHILYPNPQFYQNRSMLDIAIEQNDPKMVHIILKTGSDPNNKTLHGTPPLSLALIRITIFTCEIVRLLIDYGADPAIPNRRGYDSYQILESKRASIREEVYLELLSSLCNNIKEPGL
jgi:ankyrin repeat protein